MHSKGGVSEINGRFVKKLVCIAMRKTNFNKENINFIKTATENQHIQVCYIKSTLFALGSVVELYVQPFWKLLNLQTQLEKCSVRAFNCNICPRQV